MSARAHLLRIEFPPPDADRVMHRAVVTFVLPAPKAEGPGVEMAVEVPLQTSPSAKGVAERVHAEAQYTLRDHLRQIADALPERPPPSASPAPFRLPPKAE